MMLPQPGLAGALLGLVLAGSARAQVLEIGVGGAVTVYDRPAVFDSAGAVSIPPAAAPRHLRGKAGSRRRPVLSFKSERGVASRSGLEQAADLAALSPDLVEAVAWRESGLRRGLVSRTGAIGEMQLMPATARGLGVDPADSRQNYRGGATYLARLLKRYDGDMVRALAAYNAGSGAVDRYGGVPPYRETQAYVAAILDRLSRRAEQADR
ncbi:lytic transglycosylase domain-containing protein [Caulobacter sp. S45]|uniref:lytic transglycosylase domain-containing protein n=1 Tax=Caulobacter sp. S45 TaxID=1641861 RepID=UPI0015776DB2|nr:lytic transglycosylase domain-containing protein [Caulobacter sp. S45]